MEFVMSILIPEKARPNVKRFKDITGEKIGMLTIISHVGTETHKFTNWEGTPIQKSYSTWLARCECGSEKIVVAHTVRQHGQHCGSKDCKRELKRRTDEARLVQPMLNELPTRSVRR